MKKKFASAALAVGALTGMGAAGVVSSAPAQAAQHGNVWLHYSANYGTQSDCLTNFNGVKRNIVNHGGSISSQQFGGSYCHYTAWPAHLHRPGGYWNYNGILYFHSTRILGGDVFYAKV